MGLGFLAMDVLYGCGLVGLGLAAATVGLAVHGALHATPARALVAALLAAFRTWVLIVGIAAALLPRPRPGKDRLMGHPVFYIWMFSLLLRRFVDIPPIQTVIFQSNVLRFVVLRLLGAKISLTTSLSSDVVLLDPALLTAGPGCIVGSGAILASHVVLEGRLLLAPIRLGRDVELGARSVVSPGVTIGDGARVSVGATLGPDVTIGEGAKIGAYALIEAGVTVGRGATVLGDTLVPAGTDVPDGGFWTGEES